MSHVTPAEDRIGSLLRSADDDDLARALLADTERIVRSVLGTRDPHLIQTAANDALLAVVRYRRGFRGESKASTWLYVVTRRAALRALTRETSKTRNEISLDSLPIDMPAACACSDVQPGAALIAHELLTQLVPNPVWRRIWLLFNDPDLRLSHADIAGVTGRTAGTVAVTLSRVRALIDRAELDTVA